MNTDDLMQIGLDLVGFTSIPDDSAIYLPGDNLHRVLVGLDIGTAELLMARDLGYDAVIAHHPVGVPHKAWAVYELHVAQMTANGVPEEVAREAVGPKLRALRVDGQARNYEQVPMAARLLGMPFMSIHHPLDEMGRRVMQSAVKRVLTDNADAALGQIAERLAALPAAQRAETKVTIEIGNPDHPAGRTVVSHGAYTNGGYPVAKAYHDHGVQTVVYIHVLPGDLERLREAASGHLIIVGHITGDAIGIAPYIAALRDHGLRVDVLSKVLDPAM